jgi:hypothetical protein
MDSFREFMANQAQPQPAQQIQAAAPAPQKQKWKASKDEIIGFWKNLRPDTPIQIQPIDPNHKGSTYGEDGMRLTGSPQFISSVLARLKEFLNFESPSTNLSVSYRETESPSKVAMGDTKTSYVFYLQTKRRTNNL